MKYILLLAIISYTTPARKTNMQLFNDFHSFFAARDFNSMDKLLSEDFSCGEKGRIGDAKPDYIKYMMDWNNTFNTQWVVDTVYISGDKIISIEHDRDAFNDYFYGGEMKNSFVYSFKDDQITNLTYQPVPGYEKAEKNFDSRFTAFMKWVSYTHPFKLRYCTKHDLYSAQQVKALLEEYLDSIKNTHHI